MDTKTKNEVKSELNRFSNVTKIDKATKAKSKSKGMVHFKKVEDLVRSFNGATQWDVAELIHGDLKNWYNPDKDDFKDKLQDARELIREVIKDSIDRKREIVVQHTKGIHKKTGEKLNMVYFIVAKSEYTNFLDAYSELGADVNTTLNRNLDMTELS